jgi:cysteine rich repeat protein
MPHSHTSSPPLRIVLVALASIATSSAHAQPVPAEMRSEAMSLMQLCRGDYDRLCSGVQPGGGRILACLQTHASQLGAACGQAMPRAEVLKNGAVAAGVMPK